MAKMTVAALKIKLKDKDQKELIQEIADLYKKFPIVKEYYQAEEGGIEIVSEKYKEIIKKEFVNGHTKNFPKARLSVARKATQDFKKISTNPRALADVMLTFVESVSSFNTDFEPDVESFYTSPENMFDTTLKFLKKNDLLAVFETRAYQVVKNATDAWGHFDSLCETYEDFYGEFVQ
jgi:hypothetical protein